MDIALIFAGFVVGTIIGLSGVGGGALMTPFLVFYGIPAPVAVGTDLVYAAVTKSGAVWLHHKVGSIQWRIVGLLALGSIPSSVVAILLLKSLHNQGANIEALITSLLGAALILSSLVMIFKARIRTISEHSYVVSPLRRCCMMILTVLAGSLIGVMVTFSSVGAGALGAAILILLYPRMSPASVVGTDLAHAVPVAALAGLGHLQLGTVDFQLLGYLLFGSLPGIFLGTRLGTQLSETLVRGVLASLLFTLGVRFVV